MGSRSVSPGAALLRSSRLFSIPKPLPEPPSTTSQVSEFKSPTATRHYPQYQSVTSPLSSREKGDWGFKRPFPLASTMTTSTPLIRVKQVDSIESVTDFQSAADHSLSLEKFQEMRVAMTFPRQKPPQNGTTHVVVEKPQKSVFEEAMDFTNFEKGQGDDKRWKFEGPWLARMNEGAFISYLEKEVRPRRAGFRKLLKERLAQELTRKQSNAALDKGEPVPAPVTTFDITEQEFTNYQRTLRSDRVTLYNLVSKFLDLAPLGQPVGIVQTFWSGDAPENPWRKSGPPPSHPSAGIGYLRTNSYMENHPVYGPQGRRAPVLARCVYPRNGPSAAKLGVGGFIADVPSGDNEFNHRVAKGRAAARNVLTGILQLDTTTYGGAKASVDPQYAFVDPSGKVVLQLRASDAESQLVAKEAKGDADIYDGKKIDSWEQGQSKAAYRRTNQIADEILGDAPKPGQGKGNVVGSSSSYGLDERK